MVKFCVIYQGRPENPEAFDRHYREKHVAIIARWPKLRKIVVNRCRLLNEELYMLVEMWFDSVADLDAALASPERREAAEDRLRFPPFHGTIRHQVLEASEYSPIAG